MKIRTLLVAAALTLVTFAAGAATLVVPASGTGSGANESQWASELTLHNAAPRAIELTVALHQGTTVVGTETIALAARETLSLPDIVHETFGLNAGGGALVIEASDRDARSLVVTSRTSNSFDGGEYGQDIPAVDVAEAAHVGDLATVTGPSIAEGNRLNFGLYAVEATTVNWELLRADGTIAKTRQVAYAAGEQAQYGSGIETFLGATAEDNDTVYARIVSGKAIVFGSVINPTGDPTFVPGIPTRDDINIILAGVDLDENGTIDLLDANGDGTLDAPIVIYSSLFPSHFRVSASGEFGETVTLELVSSPARTDLLDATGTMRVVAGADVHGTSGDILVKATYGSSSSVLTIPVVFK